MTTSETTAVTESPKPAAQGKNQSGSRAIKEKIGRLYESGGGQLHLRDILNNIRRSQPAPLCHLSIENETVMLTWETDGQTIKAPIQVEQRTGKRFAVMQLPAALLSVDQVVNPRHLQPRRLEKLVEAFSQGQTRFQITQCRVLRREGDLYEVVVFDGSHGTAGEVLAGATTISCKVFLVDQLLDEEAFLWNMEAHSSLRQQEFRSRVLMSRRARIFDAEFEKFLQDPKTNNSPRSERGFVSSVPTYQRTQKLESIFDYVYSAVLEDTHEVEFEDPTTGESKTMEEPSCKLQEFVRKDEQQKRGGKLLGYDLLKATILKDFVQQGASDKIVTKLPKSEWPREQERSNLVRLCNVVAEEILENKWGQTHEIEHETGSSGKRRKSKEPTAEANISENIWKKGAVRIWSRRLRDAIGLMLGLASSDLETIFQRSIANETWVSIREGVKKIYGYGAWSSEKVTPLLGGNVIGEIERALDEWADYNGQPRLDAYHLAGRERP